MTETKTKIPSGYRPTDDEPFMNAVMKAYFRKMLMDWRADIESQTAETVNTLKAQSASHPDAIDRASATADQQLELRARDRHRKLVNKIDKALRRMDMGTYGFCDETGDPIRVRRLEARPIATLSIEAQEMHERGEKTRAG